MAETAIFDDRCRRRFDLNLEHGKRRRDQVHDQLSLYDAMMYAQFLSSLPSYIVREWLMSELLETGTLFTVLFSCCCCCFCC